MELAFFKMLVIKKIEVMEIFTLTSVYDPFTNEALKNECSNFVKQMFLLNLSFYDFFPLMIRKISWNDSFFRFVLTRLNAQDVIGYNSNIKTLGDSQKLKSKIACL